MHLAFCSIVILLGCLSLSLEMNVADLKCFNVGKAGPKSIKQLFNYNYDEFATITAGNNNTLHGPIVSKLALYRSFKKLSLNQNNYQSYKYAASSHEHKIGDAFESAEFQLDSKYTSIVLFTPMQDNAKPLSVEVDSGQVQLQLQNDTSVPIEVPGYIVQMFVKGKPRDCLAVFREALGPFDYTLDNTVVSSASTTYMVEWDEYASQKDKDEVDEELDNGYFDEKKEELIQQRKELRKDFRSTWFLFTESS